MFANWFRRGNRAATEISQATATEASFSFLGADMHSHFLPSIDDGAPDIETSIAMLKSMKQMGYNTIITTPHIMVDYYPNTPDTIRSAFNLVQSAIIENNIDLNLRAASEYFIDEFFSDKIDTGELLCITNKEVLVEFSMFSEPPMLKSVIFKMVTSGYRPIIAHPERYSYLHNDMDKFADLKDRGCLLQLNLLSLNGYYGQSSKRIAEKLLEQGLYDYCGSDAHHLKHLDNLSLLLKSKYYNQLVEYPFLNKSLCLQ